MRVYEIVGDARYGAGLAIVAANNRSQALKVLRKESNIWEKDTAYDCIAVRCIIGMSMKCKTPRVISDVGYVE